MTEKTKVIDAWDGGMFMWHLAACIALCISIVLALLEDNDFDRAGMLLVSAGAALWYIGMVVWQHRQKTISDLAMGAAITVEWLFWFILTGYSLSFMLLLAVLIPQLFMTLPLNRAVLLGIALNGLILTRFNEIDPEQTVTWALVTTVMLLSSIVMGHYIQAIIEQSRERKLLIAELETTRQSLATAERKAGVLQERQRLAQEIHDTLAQGFTSIVMHLEAAENNGDSTMYHIHEAKNMARISLVDTRNVIQALRTDISDDSSLEDNLRQLVAVWCLAHKIPAELVSTGIPLCLNHDIAHAVVRIVQESLANIRKHADATRVDVTLSYLDTALTVDIQDDGCGFNPETIQPGFGLSGMQERAAQVYGRLIVESTPEEGTTLALYIPVTPITAEDTALS